MIRAVEHSLKISAPQLLRFGIECLQDSKLNDHSINQSANDTGVYRTAPATPGLLITPLSKKPDGVAPLVADPPLSNSTTELIHTSLGTLFLSYCSNLGKGGRSSLPNLFTNQ